MMTSVGYAAYGDSVPNPSPVIPHLLYPQHLRPKPPTTIPHVCKPPLSIVANLTPPRSTATGIFDHANWVVSRPSWPKLFFPQHIASPCSVNAQKKPVPADVCVMKTPVSNTTLSDGSVYVMASTLVPACPLLKYPPQHFTEPSVSTTACLLSSVAIYFAVQQGYAPVSSTEAAIFGVSSTAAFKASVAG